jgi:serine/threonine protein kinase
MSTNQKVFDEIFKEYKNSGDIQDYGKDLGKGAFGVVKDVRFKNKAFAGKLVMKDTSEEDRLTQELRGPNIIRIQKICKPKIRGGNTYHLVIMEKAILRDLGKLNNYFHEHNLLKLKIENPFDEPLEDTLLRYYAKQIVDGFETLNRNNYVHFDVKPDNILITVNLNLKLSDFSILKRVDDNVDDFKIPGGTAGYMTPEYYLNQKLTSEGARTQDYFALGSTLFLLKYGIPFLRYRKYEDKKLIADRVVDILFRNFNYLETRELIDDELINFLTRLLNYKPEDRYSFEQIYRNKWLNKNFEYIDDVLASFENDEEKLLMEFQKQDFIIKKKENIKFINENILKKEEKNKLKKSCGKKFTFKKKDLNIFSDSSIMKLINDDQSIITTTLNSLKNKNLF